MQSLHVDTGLDLNEVARSLVTKISETLSSASAVDWALIALGFVILYWLWAGLRSKTRIGPIEVNLLDCDSPKVQLHELTGVLREELARSGFLPPPAVPAGTPQANLVAAVAASPIPQSAFIAKLIELLRFPQPLQYTLSGTLLGEEVKGKQDCGISFWLRPSGEGRPLMKTLEGQRTHREVVKQTAHEIYLYVSNEAVDAFPDWTRWRSAGALTAYQEGFDFAQKGEIARAIVELDIAASHEPGNALVQLQLANLYEQQAADDDARQADALRRYLDVAIKWPWLIQARYRASVLAGGLAGSCAVDPTAAADVHSQLRPAGIRPGEIALWLEDLAKVESAAVLQLLRPWYVPLRDGRLRNQFEPTAKERRELKRAVSISRQCLRARLRRDDAGRAASVVLLWSKFVVQVRYLALGLVRVDWQTHYLAACFDALLLERAELLGTESERDQRRRKRALSQLTKAIADADGQLSRAWVEIRDPDLKSLRDPPREDWSIAIRGLPKTKRPLTETWDRSGYQGEERSDYPARPWPKPRTRARCWLGLALAFLGGAAALALLPDTVTAAWPAILAALALFGLRQWQGAVRETVFPS